MERDLKIKSLEKEIESIAALKEELMKSKENENIEERRRKVMEKKCEQVKKLAEQQVAEAIKGDFGFLVSNPGVVTPLALNVDKENFELDETVDEMKVKNNKEFLKEFTEDIESFVSQRGLPHDKDHYFERLKDVKHRVLESVKLSQAKFRHRSLSTASKRSLEDSQTKPKMQPNQLHDGAPP